ncbi:uncharacterized protein LOC134476225 [Cavia porcellus]|uniref:uncharacterized protein LOC134476225 n=1 Tax=Cavia porcellus TaxID=10141 RepID=UPI002FE0FA1B
MSCVPAAPWGPGPLEKDLRPRSCVLALNPRKEQRSGAGRSEPAPRRRLVRFLCLFPAPRGHPRPGPGGAGRRRGLQPGWVARAVPLRRAPGPTLAPRRPGRTTGSHGWSTPAPPPRARPPRGPAASRLRPARRRRRRRYTLSSSALWRPSREMQVPAAQAGAVAGKTADAASMREPEDSRTPLSARQTPRNSQWHWRATRTWDFRTLVPHSCSPYSRSVSPFQLYSLCAGTKPNRTKVAQL